MRSRRRKRSNAWIVILTLLALATGGVWIYFYKNPPAAQNAPAPTLAPVVTGTPSSAPTDEPDVSNPVSSVIGDFEDVWAGSFARFEEFARTGENKAVLTEVRLSLIMAHADLIAPDKLLEALVQAGAYRWSGQSVQQTPLPAYISGSGESFSFGVNAPESASDTSLREENASATSLPSGFALFGRCSANKFAYAEYADSNVSCVAEFVKTGSGYLAQVYRPQTGVIRIYLESQSIACALFPDMSKDDMGSLYDAQSDWQSLVQGAEQALTWNESGAQLVAGENVQTPK